MSTSLDQTKLVQESVVLGQSTTRGTERGPRRITVSSNRRSACSNSNSFPPRVSRMLWKRRKLQDHVVPVQARARKWKVAIAYKRSHSKRYARNHVRRIHELYYIKHVGGNFLDSIELFKQKKTDIKELNELLDRNIITSPNNQHSPKTLSEDPGEAMEPITISVSESISIPIPEKIPEVVLVTIPEPMMVIQASTSITVSKIERPKLKLDKPGPSKTPKKFSEKMKAEAAVMQRVAELQKEGMWYDKRLPKSHDQTRCKSHWDYLLEEMQWLATDFAVERKWKRIAARKCAKMVEKYHADKKLAEEKAKKDEVIRVQKIASFMAKEVRNFWSNVQKLVEYKEQSKIEELRKKTMDQHLSFIVDQTEKISSMLAESFSNEVKPHRLALQDELKPEPVNTLRVFDDSLNTNLSDDEFLPTQESEDDEETIALAETEAKDVSGEVDLLQKESEMSIDDVLDELPLEYVQAILSEDTTSKQDGVIEKVSQSSPAALVSSDQKCETDYEPSESESDFEDTILEEEKLEAENSQESNAAELQELEDDNQLSLEQLRAKYSKPLDFSDDDSTDVDNGESEADTDESDEDEEESSDIIVNEVDDKTVEEELQQTSLATLLQTFAPERAGEDHGDEELNSVAAMAESFQPKGYTLSSTTVATKVPSLLKHTLREYQHIGLDWLVTMYDKKLNGILADEMGLGKTIQTIALIAHLACEKENWGPHLIIVPTSVMLNWEIEFMKWCPGLKVLTYYGSIKERKLKRTGWTKPNTFHVCITSYKILIQDHQAFRRKRWRCLILDEAQNIKNFKSQRWQLLLNFSTQRRLLLTGTPLQNNLMELWSLMHFLMPNVFQSHREFREWFSNPMTGMIEGNSEYNENIIKRLHKVLRPFILRRLKCEVEKQLPQKYEHVIMCRLSKRQRFLYEDFMSRARTKETLKTGNLLSVINVLMQLRKVCNHPNLFEPRPIISPLQTRGLIYLIPSLVWNIPDEQETNIVSYNIWNVVQNEKALDKDTPSRLRHLTSKNIIVATRRPPPKMMGKLAKSKRKFREKEYAEHQPMLVQDGDDECTIVFEKKNDPIELRRALYSYDKSKVPNPPRLRTPFAIFTMAVRPPQPLLRDKEFIHAVSLDTPDPQRLTPADIASTNWVQQDEGNFEVPNESNIVDFPLPRNITPPKRTPKEKTFPRSDYSTELASMSNGSEVVTSNGVCVSQHEKPQEDKTSTNQYRSRGVKRKRVFEYVETGLLDTIVLDVDGPIQPEEVIEEVIEPIPVASRSNGVDDEGSDEYEDSEEESQAPLKKIARLEKSVKRRSRRESDTSKFSKYIDLGEYGDYEELPETIRKRKRQVATPPRKPKENVVDFTNLEPDYIFYRKLNYRRNVIRNMRAFNAKRISIHMVYGADLLSQVGILGVMPTARYFQKQRNSSLLTIVSRQPEETHHDNRGYFKSGYHDIMMVKRIKSSQHEFERNHPYSVWRHTKGLIDAIWTLPEIMEKLEDILKRFVICTPAVTAPIIQSRVFRPSVSRYAAELALNQELSIKLKRPLKYLHPIFSSMATQFPDPRLIQYDCGKLQILDGLLRRLKSESHRALIFTQMAKMLDVLEEFLNHHGYIYLRLDGATKIDQRQLLMERFNTDKKIFCFILSTRSGGIGVNLTGADTVIFYDSDWNPTMDAQAQDRCHRIGQTRDVHIYRLVSEKTIEENILKKSNQKRLLGELAIEGGNFTTAHFKKNTIHELFDVDDEEGDAKKRMAEILDTPIPSPPLSSVKTDQLPVVKKEDGTKKVTYMFESALAAAEDESDVQAARTVRAEAAAELAEFDEDIPLDDDIVETEEQSKIQQEMEFIMSELTTVEIYALRFMERTIQDWSKDTYANAQKELEQQKLEWETEQQMETPLVLALGSPSPMSTVEEQLEDLLTYPRLPQDFWYDEVLRFKMPVYGPPTPPQDDDDMYFDQATAMLYDITSIIPEHLLPRVWQSPKKSKGGSVTEVAVTKVPVEETTVQENNSKKGGAPKVNRRDDPIFAPRSLFDRPSPALAKLRRDYKIQKLSKTGSRFPGALAIVTSHAAPKTLGPGSITFPITGPKFGPQQFSASMDLLEWTIPEDNLLLQSMTHILELPVNLLIVNLAQTPNWDFTTEVVNSISRIHRSTKQCRLRYEQVIKPREEGKLLAPPVALQKKNKKIKTFIKVVPPSPTKARSLKTSEIVASDNNAQYKNMYMKKFGVIKMLCKKRISTGSLMSFNPSMRLPKQNSVFAEHNINFDVPVSAITVAAIRHERVMADRAKMIAAQRAHQAELAAVGQTQRSLPSVIHLSSPQIQVVHSIGGNSQEQLQSQGILRSSSTNTIQQPPGLNSPVQVSSSLISTPGTPSGILLPSQATQTLSQRTFIQGSNSPIQMHQTSLSQTQQPIQVHQGTGHTMILTQGPQQPTTVTSSAIGQGSAFPIVLPVSSASMVRANNLLQTSTIQTESQSTLNPLQTPQKFVITQRDLQQQQHQHIQLQSAPPSNQSILITSSQSPTAITNPMGITSSPILVSSGTTPPSSGIVIPHQSTATVTPRSPVFFQTGTPKQQIQINSQSKQVFISQQAETTQILTSQAGQTMVLAPTLAQALSVSPTSSPGISSNQPSLVSGTTTVCPNVITIPSKVQPAVFSQGQQLYTLHDLVTGAHIIPTTASPPRNLVSSPEVSHTDTLSGLTSSSGGTTVLGAVKTVPTQGTVPTYVARNEIEATVSESARTGVTGSGNNIFVQLTGVPPGTKLTQTQIQQLRQSILHQQKGFVNVSPPSSQQSLRPDSPTQQMKRIQIVPTSPTQTNVIGTSSSPTQLTIPASTTLPCASTSPNTSQSLTAIPSSSGNIVAINTGMGTRLMKQQIVGGKSITRPVSEADIQMFLKQRGFTQPGATRINVAPTPGMSSQVTTVGANMDQGDVQSIPTSISPVSGLQEDPSQGRTIIFPTKGTPASPIPTTGHQLITVPISQTQGLKNPGAKQPIIATVCLQKGGGTNQVSLVRGIAPVSTLTPKFTSACTTIKQEVKTSTIAEKPQSFGLVSALSLARNTSMPSQNRNARGNQTLPLPKINLASQTINSTSFTRPSFITKDNVINVNTSHVVSVNTRPTISLNQTTTMKPRYYTPVSQVSLVRGTVPMSTISTTTTTLPVTYSAAKTSILKVPATSGESSVRSQLIQQQPHRLTTTPTHPLTITATKSPATPLTVTTGPPQLIANTSNSNTAGVITIFTTSANTLSTESSASNATTQ